MPNHITHACLALSVSGVWLIYPKTALCLEIQFSFSSEFNQRNEAATGMETAASIWESFLVDPVTRKRTPKFNGTRRFLTSCLRAAPDWQATTAVANVFIESAGRCARSNPNRLS